MNLTLQSRFPQNAGGSYPRERMSFPEAQGCSLLRQVLKVAVLLPCNKALLSEQPPPGPSPQHRWCHSALAPETTAALFVWEAMDAAAREVKKGCLAVELRRTGPTRTAKELSCLEKLTPGDL